MTEQKQRVLVIDDQPQNITVLNEILKSEYAISASTNGAKALSIAKSDNPPDLILLDVMMPGMDGFEVCKRLKADKKTKDIPVIFVTAKGEIDDKIDAYEHGATDYITKPVDPSLTLAVVKKHLKKK